jgi:hypothetical protein
MCTVAASTAPRRRKHSLIGQPKLAVVGESSHFTAYIGSDPVYAYGLSQQDSHVRSSVLRPCRNSDINHSNVALVYFPRHSPAPTFGYTAGTPCAPFSPEKKPCNLEHTVYNEAYSLNLLVM